MKLDKKFKFRVGLDVDDVLLPYDSGCADGKS